MHVADAFDAHVRPPSSLPEQRVKSTLLNAKGVLIAPILGSHSGLGAFLQAVPSHWALLISLSARGRLQNVGAGRI